MPQSNSNCMKKWLFILLLGGVNNLWGQTNVGLVARYTFDNDFNDASGNTTNSALPAGNPGFVCGVVERAVSFNGGADALSIIGDVITEFDTEDFTVGFYFKATGTDGIQYLLSKRSTNCQTTNAFYIRYRPSTRNINVYFAETPERSINLVSELPAGNCWYHIAVVREGARLKLFVNGRLVANQGTVGRADIKNDGKLLFGATTCYGPNETPFRGLLDEVRIYNRALRENEATGLYTQRPDNIISNDTIVFLGAPVPIRLAPTCATEFSWSPTAGVFLADVGATSILPPNAGVFTYTLSFRDQFSTCRATDSIRITVVDPRTLECGKVLLPNAFTPNGDGLNETFGISNPYSIGELRLFEIFDRWGGRVFVTANPFAQWDGFHLGQPVNPGVMWYKILHVCNGAEKLVTGSFMVMK